MTVTLLTGDVRVMLATLPAESVHCVVTSPPYWGLRDYGTATWEGGDATCTHDVSTIRTKPELLGCTSWSHRDASGFNGNYCRKCRARRIDRQLGLEATPEEHVANIVEVFREVWRVLRKDGTCWINYGDSYASGEIGRHDALTAVDGNSLINYKGLGTAQKTRQQRRLFTGLKPKDLVGMPWRVAFTLQADGWWLRSDIIWAKPNPMPESVTDRPTKSHEYVFLLTKSAKYFYDTEAVREKHGELCRRDSNFRHQKYENHSSFDNSNKLEPRINGRAVPENGRNLRSVWTIPTAPFSEAHFATFPPKLAETCILAGTSAKGCCSICGAPLARKRIRTESDYRSQETLNKHGKTDFSHIQRLNGKKYDHSWSSSETFIPSCSCPPASPVPCTVLDPFAGAGTTLMVADRLQRHAIGIDLNTEYAAMAVKRIKKDQGPLFAEVL